METPATGRTKRQKSHEFNKKLIKLTAAGGAAFWIVDFAISISPITAEYMAAFSISSLPLALVQALVGGLIIACFVSYFLLRFFNKIPTKNPILKTLILSFAAIGVIEVLSTLGNPSNAYVYLLVDTVMNIPRILALGIGIGYLYKKLYGSESLC
jgi:CBS-domain-containing membrane protein